MGVHTRLLGLAAALAGSPLHVPALRLHEDVGPVLFAGDSTLRYQFELLCGDKLSITKVHGYWMCQVDKGYDAYYIDYMKLAQRHKDLYTGPDGATMRLRRLTGLTPRVVYFNFYGLWDLHLEPVLRWREPRRRREYTPDRLCQSMQHTVELGVRSLILMTTHHVCESRFDGPWAAILQEPGTDGESPGAEALSRGEGASRSTTGTDTGCRSYVAMGCSGLPMGMCGDDVEALCRASTLTAAGAERLVEQELPACDLCRAAGVRVAAVHAHSITAGAGCGHTVDGRHYDTETVAREVEAYSAALANVTA
mmetsp:Transcript_148948/g.460013  ORF Transcript_148948/g.460013 Transcript_148948/m.460013 type:complete len:309 (+) Transcript_148948:32-958(+)